MGNRKTVSIAVAVLLALATVAPAAASPGAQTTSRRTLSLEQAKKMASGPRSALFDDDDWATEFISGTVTPDGGLWQDAWVAAIAIHDDGGGWEAAGTGEVASDGTYRIGLWAGPGTYRVAFFDMGNVYEDVYYKDALTPEAGTDVAVAAGQTVTGIDQTLTPLPETMIAGNVYFEGAPPPPPGSVEVVGMQYLYDAEEGAWDWWWVSFNTVKADGSYRLHLRSPGTYRVGFWDYTGAFAEVYYKDAADVESATDVSVDETGTTVAGIDQTMTVVPSKVLAGKNRYATAAAVSREAFPEEFYGTVVLATGENWPDALVASPLAGVSWAPLLLTRKGSLPGETLNEILRLQPFEVVIVGSYDAVSLATEVNLRLLSDVPVVRRLNGRDRYETAALVAHETLARMWEETADGAIVVSGETYADAMAAGPPAVWTGTPILLTRKDTLPAVTARWLKKRKVSETLVVGGTAAVGKGVAAQLPDVTRVGGRNRYGTAVALARHSASEYGMSTQMFGVASGEDFPDGLVAGPLLGWQGRCLLLMRAWQPSGETLSFLGSSEVAGLTFFGGEAALAPWVVDELLDAAGLPPVYGWDDGDWDDF
ncbi:MAG: cell wall-binding repeat-containing protein [Coriobacteriia bacterium]|nr:cell wall-binding repeat-containing protein [Coriobacteriia bacterium]